MVLGTIDGSAALQLNGSISDTDVIADGKLTIGAIIAKGLNDKFTGKVVPIALDILTKVTNTPFQRATAGNSVFTGGPTVDFYRRCRARHNLNGEAVGNIGFVLCR